MRYLVQSIAWSIFIFLVGWLQYGASQWRNSAFFPTTTTFHILSYILPILIFILFGGLLGCNRLIREYKKAGSWKIHYRKLIWLGMIPNIIVIFVGISYDSLREIVNLDRVNLTTVHHFALILFGFYLTQSFTKK